MASLDKICADIILFEQKYARQLHSVQLIAVSKTRSQDEVLSLHKLGQQAFGENYLQEALTKIKNLDEMQIEWHFIGAIQSKKAQNIAHNFDWVHSLDRIKVAKKLSQAREGLKPLKVLIQVNLEREISKGGVFSNELATLALQVQDLPNLELRGLMFMPKVHSNFIAQREIFKQAKGVFEVLKKQIPSIDQISMGMSADMEAAIAEGATMVRIGSALFGKRERNNEINTL